MMHSTIILDYVLMTLLLWIRVLIITLKFLAQEILESVLNLYPTRKYTKQNC